MEMQAEAADQKEKEVRILTTQINDEGRKTGTVDMWTTDRAALRELAENVLLDIVPTDDGVTYGFPCDLLDHSHKKAAVQP